MKVAFRVDASTEIGTGHVSRCLALAEALRAEGADVSLVSRALPAGVDAMLREHAVDVVDIGDCIPGSSDDSLRTRQALARLAENRPVDWLIVDHYRIAAPWETSLRPAAARIMVIDDLADRPHDCDLLLDQNFYFDKERRYVGLLPARCITALGPTFAILRPEFYAAMRISRRRDGSLHRVLVAFGGADPTNETAKVLEALSRPEFSNLRVDVALGGANRHAESVTRKFGGDPRVRLHRSPANLAALMATADLAVGAGGTMNWERCCLGLPAIVVIVAKNQAETSRALHQAGAIVSLGWHAEVTAARIATTITELAADSAAMLRLGEQAIELMAPGGRFPRHIAIVDTLMDRRHESRQTVS
jgi:UDP-2,4-diacetamido-2,4,6-trideoxy-beta-L-altropyranose hydrolase